MMKETMRTEVHFIKPTTKNKRLGWFIFFWIGLLVLAGVGCATTGKAKKEVQVEFRLAYNKPKQGATMMIVPGIEKKVYVDPYPVLTRMDIASATVVEDPAGLGLEFIFTPVGSARLYEVTSQNVGNRLALFINGKLVAAPIIREPITAGRAVMFGKLDRRELERIAKALSQ